jgi:hypothetical protein
VQFILHRCAPLVKYSTEQGSLNHIKGHENDSLSWNHSARTGNDTGIKPGEAFIGNDLLDKHPALVPSNTVPSNTVPSNTVPSNTPVVFTVCVRPEIMPVYGNFAPLVAGVGS